MEREGEGTGGEGRGGRKAFPLFLFYETTTDLNPVDYAIWGALQQMVHHRQRFVSVDELKRTIVEAWQKLPQSFIDKSVR